ncbi:MAG: hypothetical protein K8T89_11475, partial [Planctomycetes bacterium]|nr:hypothetical protein [Planctomycetota bacterium]
RVRAQLMPIANIDSPLDLKIGDSGNPTIEPMPIAPGKFFVRVGADQVLTPMAQIDAGDRLLARIVDRRGSLALERVFFANEAASLARGPADPQAYWKSAVLEHRLTEKGGSRLLAVVEDRPPIGVDVQACRIGDAYFDLAAVTPGKKAFSTRVTRVDGYPAPAFRFTTRAWPSQQDGLPAPASLESWWNPPGTSVAVATLDMPSPFREPLPIEIGKDVVTIDSFAIEEHEVEVRPGVIEKRSCLSVRLSHPSQRAYLVRVHDAGLQGVEQRFYREANRVTCLFWRDKPWNLTKMQLELVSLADAERAARTQGRYLKLDAIPAPVK